MRCTSILTAELTKIEKITTIMPIFNGDSSRLLSLSEHFTNISMHIGFLRYVVYKHVCTKLVCELTPSDDQVQCFPNLNY